MLKWPVRLSMRYASFKKNKMPLGHKLPFTEAGEVDAKQEDGKLPP